MEWSFALASSSRPAPIERAATRNTKFWSPDDRASRTTISATTTTTTTTRTRTRTNKFHLDFYGYHAKTHYIHWWYEWTRYWAWFKLNVNRQLHASRMDLLVLVTGDRGVVWESKTDTCKSKNHNYHVIISPLIHMIGFHRFKPRK